MALFTHTFQVRGTAAEESSRLRSTGIDEIRSSLNNPHTTAQARQARQRSSASEVRVFESLLPIGATRPRIIMQWYPCM